jgi:ABC-type branched-subunit amino acid transport system permease subunit
MIAFVVGAALAGAAGSLLRHYVGFVSPDLFNFSYVTIMLIMVISAERARSSVPRSAR